MKKRLAVGIATAGWLFIGVLGSSVAAQYPPTTTTAAPVDASASTTTTAPTTTAPTDASASTTTTAPVDDSGSTTTAPPTTDASDEAPADTDSDGDGFGDNADVFPSDPAESKDSDSDGVGDNADGFPLISLGGRADNDNDGMPDVCDIECQSLGLIADADDDNDGTNDIDDAFPFDPTKSAPRGCSDPCLSVLDIDADGIVAPLSDGLVLLRYLFGLDSDALVKGALGDDAVRTDPDEIAAYIKILLEGEE